MKSLVKRMIYSVMRLARQSLKTPSRAGYYQPKSNELKSLMQKRGILFAVLLAVFISFSTLKASCEELDAEPESLIHTVNETVGTIVVQDYNIGGTLYPPLKIKSTGSLYYSGNVITSYSLKTVCSNPSYYTVTASYSNHQTYVLVNWTATARVSNITPTVKSGSKKIYLGLTE